MIQSVILRALLVCGVLAGTAQAQVLSNETARYYLPTATVFPQAQIDAYNLSSNYQFDILSGQALSYPDMTPVQLTWNGTDWESATPVALTTPFTTLLMVGPITHSAVTPQPGQTNAQVTVDWDDVPGVTQYRLRIRQPGGTWNPSTITGSQRVMTTLAFNTNYEVQARVYINSTTQGEYTSTYSFTTPPAPPPLPTCNPPTVNATLTQSSLSLNWSPVPYATAYQVETREVLAPSFGGTTITGTTYTQAALPGKAYEIRVRSSCVGTQTSWSAFATLTRTTAVCTPPTGMLATVVGNQVTYTFTPHPYADKTFIQINRLGTATWGGTTVTGNSRTFTLHTPGEYQWRVRSTCLNTVNTGWTSFVFGPNYTYGVAAQRFSPGTDEGVSSAEETPSRPDAIFDMSGRRLNLQRDQLPAGVYIINGKQVGIVR